MNKNIYLKNYKSSFVNSKKIIVSFLSVYITLCASPGFAQAIPAQIIYEGNQKVLPEGWAQGAALFQAQFRAILPPLTIQLDDSRPTAVDAWIEQVSKRTFRLSFSAIPYSVPRNQEIAVHELTHALHLSYRPHEAVWVQEGVALLSEALVLKHRSSLERIAYQSPENSLIGDQAFDSEAAHGSAKAFALYGQWRLLFKFLYQFCGRDELLTRLITSDSPLNGVEFIDQTLRQTLKRLDNGGLPFCGGFDSAFTEFESRKFSQSASRGLDLGPFHGLISQEPKVSLEPYSASAYDQSVEEAGPGAAVKRCEGSDIALGTGICLQIRTH